MVEEGEGGCPEGPVSRPVRERQLSRQRGGQREGAGGGTKAWHATHAPTSLRCAHTGLPSSPRPVLHCSQHPKNPTVQWSCSLSRRGLSLQHVGQWSCSLSRRGSPCSTWVSGPVLSRVGTFPAACGSVVLSSLTGGSPCSTWVSVHPVPGVPAPLFADVLFQTSGPTQPWFPPAYLAAPSAFPAHF